MLTSSSKAELTVKLDVTILRVDDSKFLPRIIGQCQLGICGAHKLRIFCARSLVFSLFREEDLEVEALGSNKIWVSRGNGEPDFRYGCRNCHGSLKSLWIV